MSTQPDQPTGPPSNPHGQPNRDRDGEIEYPRIDSANSDTLLVSSIPIFIMDDSSTDEDDSSAPESTGSSPMSEGNTTDVEGWVRESSDGAFESDETVVHESSSRYRSAAHDGDGDDPLPKSQGRNGFVDESILEDRYAGEHTSIHVLPGVFGELVHYGEGRERLSSSSSSYTSGDLVQEDSDTAAGQDRSRDPKGLIDRAGDSSEYRAIDEMWMKSLLNLPWVNKDLTMIFDPKPVIDLFSFIIKGAWFIQLSDAGNWMQRTIPVELWREVLTLGERYELHSAVRKKIHEDIVTRAITVVEEWRLRSGFAKVPEIEKEVLDAKEKVKARLDLKCMILEEVSIKSVDRWIKYVFQGIMDAEHLDRILGHAVLDIRRHVIGKLIRATELPFSGCWTVTRSLKVPLQNQRKVESVIEEQLNGLFDNLNIQDE
ncbi:hypothetical protein VTL71DRAFT_2779 [Oculimacula yallundae]|uniref:Uncharacterized protein n=1 Tax=Oculimacula yallundae TaxID=86028 RepID=A0ABR4CB09_9HELO